VTAPADARAALARIVATIAAATRLECVTGWTLYDPSADVGELAAVLARGLARGAQERERYRPRGVSGLRSPMYLESASQSIPIGSPLCW
jgi:hypothetical protein